VLHFLVVNPSFTKTIDVRIISINSLLHPFPVVPEDESSFSREFSS